MSVFRRGKSGRALAKVLALVITVGIVLSVLYYFLVQVRRGKECEANLLKIYRALELYELDRGELPALAYYPDDPKEDPDSLRVVLESYGVDAISSVCPSAPASIAETGLSYIWNSALNGKKMPRSGEPVWLLVDITGLSVDVPAPHLRRYNVLYSDGRVRKVASPLRELKGL